MQSIRLALVTAQATLCVACVYAAESVNVVTTMSSFADLARTVGGNHVRVSFVAPPQFNPHFIEPRPSDVLKVKRADLFVHGGLDLEAWRDALVNAAANPHVRPNGGRELRASDGISLMNIPQELTRAEGDIHVYGNPHFWIDPRNGLIIAKNIALKLSEIDPAHATDYAANLKRLQSRLKAGIRNWELRLSPHRGRELAGYHDEWPYLMDFAGLEVQVFLEPKPGIPPTPKHLAIVRAYVREQRIPGIIQATYSPDRASRRLAKKTGIRIVKLCQNVGEVPEATNYISMTEYNVAQLLGAFE